MSAGAPAALVEAVRAAWGRAVVVRGRLDGEADETWRLEDADGPLVLKLSPATADRADLQRQLDALDALVAGLPRWRFPEPQRTAAGATLVDLGGRPGRLLTFVEGTPLAQVGHRSPRLLEEVGALAAGCVTALADVPGDPERHDWDLRRIGPVLDGPLGALAPEVRADVEVVRRWLPPSLDALPQALVHHDLNDHNVLVRPGPGRRTEVAGAIDVGDLLRTARVAELAIAAAYAMLRTASPLRAAAHVVAGFHAALPLTDDEVAVVFPLAAGRLCANAATWAQRLATGEAADYGRARSAATPAALALLARVDPAFAEATLRAACGWEPWPAGVALRGWLAEQPALAVVDGLDGAEVVDLSPAADRHDDPAAPPLAALGRDRVAVAPHLGPRLDRAGRRRGEAGPATVQLGVDLFTHPGREVRLALGGRVVGLSDDALVVEHADAPGGLWSAVRGLDPGSVPAAGTDLAAGAPVGRTAAGGPAHGHWTLTTARPGPDLPPPGFAAAQDLALWRALAPDPTGLLAMGPVPAAPARLDEGAAVAARDARVARSQRSYYRRPPLLTRARGTWFTDDQGRQYLDAINNVTHVGHAHPKVVEAGVRQMRRLNTNSRFLYEGLAACADRITGLLPDGLDVVFFVCTGSEANDLALRIARTCTGRDHVATLGAAYHGNTTAVTGISPDRFDGAGGVGPPATTHVLPQPDRYRGAHGYDHPDPGAAYAADALAVIDRMVAAGTPPAAVFTEPLQGTAGQVLLPAGYLAAVYRAVRAAGGLCVADEVQVGLGRLGSCYWGFEDHGVVPDIVTMGKPLGNGHPVAAVVTTREIADAFDNGMRYFNTFGGNPVSCAIAMAVLDVVEEEGLQERARVLGDRLLRGLDGLRRHELVGDVRGQGLYAGVELVEDRDTKAPAGAVALEVSERMMELGVLTYPNGRFGNILKLKPPMVATGSDIDLIVEVLDEVLETGW